MRYVDWRGIVVAVGRVGCGIVCGGMRRLVDECGDMDLPVRVEVLCEWCFHVKQLVLLAAFACLVW